MLLNVGRCFAIPVGPWEHHGKLDLKYTHYSWKTCVAIRIETTVLERASSSSIADHSARAWRCNVCRRGPYRHSCLGWRKSIFPLAAVLAAFPSCIVCCLADPSKVFFERQGRTLLSPNNKLWEPCLRQTLLRICTRMSPKEEG